MYVETFYGALYGSCTELWKSLRKLCRELFFKLGATVSRDVQWYSEARKPGCRKAWQTSSTVMECTGWGFRPSCAAVDKSNIIPKWWTVDGRYWSYNIHLKVCEAGGGFNDLAYWRIYIARDFHLLASEAVVASFVGSPLGFWPREGCKGHTWRWFPGAVT